MKVAVYNQAAQQTGDLEVALELFGQKPDQHLMAEAVRIQLSNARFGLANTKTRGEVAGGGKKPWKQKGTGRARAGSTRSPIWRHGGVTFGPTAARNWELKLNRKAKTKALAMALSDKLASGKLIVLESLALPNNKTKEMAAVIYGFEQNVSGFGSKHLIVAPSSKWPALRAIRNLEACRAITAASVNIVEVLKAEDVIILGEALPVLEKTFIVKGKV